MLKSTHNAYMIGYRWIVLRSQGKFGLSYEGLSGINKRELKAYEAGKVAARGDLCCH